MPQKQGQKTSVPNDPTLKSKHAVIECPFFAPPSAGMSPLGSSSGSSSSDNTTDDVLVEFGECTDSIMVTCDSDVLTLTQYNNDTCTATVNQTTTMSHEDCYLTSSYGCSTTGECYCI